MMVEHECTEEARIKRNEDDIQDVWKAVDDIKRAMTYRLPLWAVGVWGLMCASLTLVVTLYVHK